jgi:site-specific DNA-methyltransferase (adenine-specific)
LKIINGDVLSVLKRQQSNSFDGCLTDPPYGLSFMGKEWDRGVPSAEVWAEVLRVLKPGAWMLAFGGTRTYHRLTCAIEDAGFEIRDCLSWLYGSGFPKGKGCLKPAWEPIVLARKRAPGPLLNIDACRIGTTRGVPWGKLSEKRSEFLSTLKPNAASLNPNIGRWPANVLLDEAAAVALDQMSGVSRGGKRTERTTPANRKGTYSGFDGCSGEVNAPNTYGDTGGASRFFYVAKASRRERGEGNIHPTVKPIKLAEHLAKLILPAGESKRLLVPFCGSGSECIGARNAGWKYILGIELQAEYKAIAEQRLKAA